MDVREDLGWRPMPRPSTAYSFLDFDPHKVYITDAAALFPAASVDFSVYRFVFIVAPPDAAFPVSPAFNARPGTGAPSPSLYTVDATVPTLESPVVVIPKTLSASPVYGGLYEAPYGVGDRVSVTDGSASLAVTVLQKFGSSSNVKIEYRRWPSGLGALVAAVLDALAALIRSVRFRRRSPASPGPWPVPRSPAPSARSR